MSGDPSVEPQQQRPPWGPIPGDGLTMRKRSTSPKSFAPSTPTEQARRLRGSSRRRTWSTLLDRRDWTSYLHLLAALLLFVYMPWKVYQLYEKSKVQATVIDSIADDPDFRQVLDLLVEPSDWASIDIGERAEPTELDYSGLEILTHSRMLDLRKWNADETSPDQQGRVLLRDRVTFKLVDAPSSGRRVTFRNVLPIEDVEFRQPKGRIPAVVSQVKKPVEGFEGRGTSYEIEYDLARLPFGEPVTVEIAALARFPGLMSGRAPFVVPMQGRPARGCCFGKSAVPHGQPGALSGRQECGAADDGSPKQDRPPLRVADWLVGGESPGRDRL